MEVEPSTSGVIKRSIPKELQDKMDETAAKIPRVTATPAVLNDNQKRYLVVGICLHSVISPALRKYVVPILTALYEELILTQKIDTQTYSAYLKQYQPTNTTLNYKAVNNNKTANGKANYDYKIKSVVDLSKLFLLPHMAHYTGFDETCDSSALLGLIINIDDKFPSAVISYAEDVRRNVRNPWAHCDFTEWDAVKYTDSFQLMETLVQDLRLSSTDETHILQEMKKWEINGPSSLNGTNEICRLLNVLVESLKRVANETDTNSLETKNAQENCATISSTLSQLQNDMETRFLEINKRFLALEENQDKLLDSQRVEIEFWEDQELTFVYTPVVNVISEIMESEHSVLIIGEPGIGKSMLMHNVALKVQKNMDYDIIPCTGVQDILQHYKQDNKQMFVMDDICGRFTVNMSAIIHWMDNEDSLKRILKTGKTKIVATCRLDIYNDEKFKQVYPVFESNIFNLSERYTREDKIKICRNYLSEADIQLVKEQNIDFTPLMCYLYSKNETLNLTGPFKTHQKKWEKEDKSLIGINSDYSLPFAGNNEEFINLLATGTYESFENRVFLCGSCACGKSTLASVLIGNPIPLKWKSTDGLVIHFGRNGINLETFEMVPLKGDDRGQNVWTKVVIGKPNSETSEYRRSDSHHDKLIASSSSGTDSLKSSDDKIGKSEDLPDTNTITFKKEKGSYISLPKVKKIEAYAVHDDILKEVKSGQYKIKIAPSDLVDFGGQRSYDMTHQLFVQHGGTFVVMFDGSRDFHEPLKEYPTGDISNESIVKHWVDSILTYCVDDNDVMPMILFAATHSDLLSETQKECPSTCPGLETKRLTTSPSEKQLSRLVDQLDNNSCRELMIHLGLQQKDWKDIKDCYTSPLIMRIMALHVWKTKRIKGKPTKSFSNLLDALTAIGDHRHLLCKVFREDTELIDIADVRLQKVPSDDVLNGLPMNLGNCAIQLGIELGITMSSIDETMVRHHKDMYSQIYDILRKWKCSCEVKPTIYRLMLALERVHIGGLEYLQDVYLRH